MGAIKTLESFEGLLDRPAVAVVVRKCGAAMMLDLTLDLRRVCLHIFPVFFASTDLPALHCAVMNIATALASAEIQSFRD